MLFKWLLLITGSLLFTKPGLSQSGKISGYIFSSGKTVANVTLSFPKSGIGVVSDSTGYYEMENIPLGKRQMRASSIGFELFTKELNFLNDTTIQLDIQLTSISSSLNEVVITGTMKEIRRSESPVPVEIITPKLFQKNPTPSLFEAVGMLNGVKPQLNCSVCNTGDIHINGMEGPYTMILIDGMPIVSALSTVYGLSGIPNSMVERIEVVKGPASSLYGSEAMGGIINVITKSILRAPRLSTDVFATSWGEVYVDASAKFKAGKATSLIGLNYFNYQNPIDNNNDNFTDVTLQHRISIFNKWDFRRDKNRIASIAARYVYETRWGGEINWSTKWRGSDSIYGESIYTNRAEIFGLYQLPVNEKIFTQFSFNSHHQDSWYGTTPYVATQDVAFLQTYWDKRLNDKHNLLLGASFRYTVYDDNTPATASPTGDKNKPAKTPLPGIFVQDEWAISPKHTLLAGYRYDYNRNHGSVHSPRIAFKISPDPNHTIRASFGTGFRVVNLFTEDHAALTGAREVVIAGELNPERSYNSTLNYVYKIHTNDVILGWDMTVFYSYFTNKIIGDFDMDPTKIIYDNLNGHAISRGISLNADLTFKKPLRLLAGISFMDVYQMEENSAGKMQRIQQLHAPKWSGNFVVSYSFPKKFNVDLTGKWDGPMRLPILPNDYRPEYSPTFCIANIQLTKKWNNGIELYGGLKNIFNFVPEDPILRPFDPFNKSVEDPINNPYGFTFDPGYNYSSMQGIRGFLGLRYSIF